MALLAAWGLIAAVVAAAGGYLGMQLTGALPVTRVTDIMTVTLAGGLIIMALPDRLARWIRWIAAVSGFVALVLSISLACAYVRPPAAGQWQFEEWHAWIPSIGISYHLAVDGIAAAMILLTGIIIFTGVLASWTVEHRAREFFALLLLLVTGVFGVFAAQDLFLFFLFYEVAVLPMYLLIGIWGTGRKEYSAMKLTLYLLLGSAFMLVGFLALYFGTSAPGGMGGHTFDLTVIRAHLLDGGAQRLFFPFIFLGFGVLAGFWPFHTWSPDGHASAPTAVSMLHAGVLMKLGAFGILRIGIELMPEGAHAWTPIFVCFTLVNITYGSFAAMSQTDLKYVTAYSSVSHMGIVILGLCTLNDAGLNGAVLQMFSHGIMTGLFFGLIGFTYSKTHTRIITEYGGLGRKMPVLATFFTIGGLTSLGLPGLSGFVAEFMVFVGAWRMNPWICSIAAVGVVVTAAYVLRMLQKCFWGPLTNPHYDHIPDATPVEIATLTILAGVLLWVGLTPGWLVGLINSGVQPVLAVVNAAATAVAPAAAVVAGGAR